MKYYFLLVLGLLVATSVYIQNKCDLPTLSKEDHFHSTNIRKSVFENVIEITSDDIIQKGTNYVVNVRIPKTKETPVLFVSARVPLEKLSGIYPEFQKLIVISPNWKLYDEVAKSMPDGGCAEPRTSTIIYEFIRENGKLIKDSIIVMDTFPVINYKK